MTYQVPLVTPERISKCYNIQVPFYSFLQVLLLNKFYLQVKVGKIDYKISQWRIVLELGTITDKPFWLVLNPNSSEYNYKWWTLCMHITHFIWKKCRKTEKGTDTLFLIFPKFPLNFNYMTPLHSPLNLTVPPSFFITAMIPVCYGNDVSVTNVPPNDIHCSLQT